MSQTKTLDPIVAASAGRRYRPSYPDILGNIEMAPQVCPWSTTISCFESFTSFTADSTGVVSWYSKIPDSPVPACGSGHHNTQVVAVAHEMMRKRIVTRFSMLNLFGGVY